MSDRSRRFLRDIVAYGAGEMIVKAVTFLALPVYTRIFGPTEFGAYASVVTLAALASTALILGGDSAYSRYFFAARSLPERRSLTTTWIGFLAVESVLVSLLLASVSGVVAMVTLGSDSQGAPLAFAFLTAGVGVTNRMLGQALRNSFRPWAYAGLNIGGAVLTVALPLFAVTALNGGLAGLFAGSLAAEVLQLPFRLWATRDLMGRQVATRLLRRLLAFGLPIVPTTLAYWIFLFSDRLVLNSLSGQSQVGLYAAAAAIVAAANAVISAVGQAWGPHALSAFEEDEQHAKDLVRGVAPYLVAGFGLLAVLLSTFASEAVAIVAGAEFLDGSSLVLPLSLGMVAQATTSLTALGINVRYRTGYLASLAWIAALVNLTLNLLLDEKFGAWGAAWATAISYATLSIAYAAVSQRLWPVVLDRRRVGMALMIVVAFTVASSATSALGVALKGLYVGACVMSLILFGVVRWRDASLLIRPTA